MAIVSLAQEEGYETVRKTSEYTHLLTIKAKIDAVSDEIRELVASLSLSKK